MGGLLRNILKFAKETWIDWLTLVAVGILTGGVSQSIFLPSLGRPEN